MMQYLSHIIKPGGENEYILLIGRITFTFYLNYWWLYLKKKLLIL